MKFKSKDCMKIRFTHEDNVLYNETRTQPVDLSLLTMLKQRLFQPILHGAHLKCHREWKVWSSSDGGSYEILKC